MKLVECNKNDIRRFGLYKKSKLQTLLEEFIDSGMVCAKIEGWTQTSVSSAQSSISRAIVRYKMYNIQCISRRGEVFLIRTDMEN